MLNGILGILQQLVTFQCRSPESPHFMLMQGLCRGLWLQPPSICETPNAVLAAYLKTESPAEKRTL